MKLWDFFTKKGQNDQTEKKSAGKPETDSSQRAESADSNEIHPPHIVSEIGKARYFFEHRLLREQFYSNTRQFINAILKEDGIYKMACFVAQLSHVDNPYCQADFHVDSTRWNSDINIVGIELPAPQFTPLCYRIYLFFSDDYTNLGYYTIECGMRSNGFLCGWSSEGIHYNYHEIEKPAWEDQQKEIHKAKEMSELIELHAKEYGLKSEQS